MRAWRAKRLSCALILFWACGSEELAPIGQGVECASDAACDNGVYCDGVETCYRGACLLGAPPNCNDNIGCTIDICSEELQACLHEPRDADGDGFGDIDCVDGEGTPLGTDCDDLDSARFPGNTEICDAAGHDEDCDDTTFGVADEDGDGFVSSACCNGEACGSDCDDVRANVKPTGVETCDQLDNDCDGITDENVAIQQYADEDGDGFGDPNAPVTVCAGQARTSHLNTDCDDTDPARHPGQLEVCDGIDNDCDLIPDENTQSADWYPDVDQDRFGDPAGPVIHQCVPPADHSLLPTDCDDSDPAISPVAPEQCDGLDNDCNGLADFRIGVNDFEDDDGDGLIDAQCEIGTDCDDHDRFSGAGSAEICDGRDNDCDGTVDEGALDLIWYADEDGDGFGSAESGLVVACEPPGAGYTPAGGDCDDDNALRHPGLAEVCNGLDEDCDASVDEGINFAADPTNCGACGHVCDGALPSLTGACVAGSCECAAGFGDCDGNPANGCEQDLTSAVNHCGSCNNLCTLDHAAAECSDGACEVLACFGAWGDCNTLAGDGCELELVTDENCGGCGVDCSTTLLNVNTPACRDASCSYDSCMVGFADCQTPGDGCETHIDSDSANCGACDVNCLALPNTDGSCLGGQCQCGADFGECDGIAANGCETDFRDVATCGTSCIGLANCERSNQNGSPTCNTGSCDVVCNENWEDCGGDPLVCETHLVTLSNCGSCGNTCGTGTNGTSLCLPGDQGYRCDVFCDFGFADCDDDGASCEVDLRTDANNCGTCGHVCTGEDVCQFGQCTAPGGGGGGGTLTFSKVAVGANFSCALTEGGKVYCWGSDARGQLGDGPVGNGSDRESPAEVINLDNAVDIYAGGQVACAVTDEMGTLSLYCWGDNTFGQLAMSPVTTHADSPTAIGQVVIAGTGVVAVGANHVCSIVSGQPAQLHCWGRNASGQLGIGTASEFQHLPQPVAVMGSMSSGSVRAGADHTCVVSDLGDLHCWGENQYGQVGDGGMLPDAPDAHAPELITASVARLATGSSHTCAGNGMALSCTGRNIDFQLGVPVPTETSTLTLASFSDEYDVVVGYGAHTCGVLSAGDMKCWGSNAVGQLGRAAGSTHIPDLVNFSEAIRVQYAPNGPTSNHTCIVDHVGRVWCWGVNSNGQLARPLEVPSSNNPEIVVFP